MLDSVQLVCGMLCFHAVSDGVQHHTQLVLCLLYLTKWFPDYLLFS